MRKTLQRFSNLPHEIKNHCTKRPKPTAPEQARIKKGVAGHSGHPLYDIKERLLVHYAADDIEVGIYKEHIKFILARNEKHIGVCSGVSPVKVGPIFIAIHPGIAIYNHYFLRLGRVGHVKQNNIGCVIIEMTTLHDSSIFFAFEISSSYAVVILHPG